MVWENDICIQNREVHLQSEIFQVVTEGKHMPSEYRKKKKRKNSHIQIGN